MINSQKLALIFQRTPQNNSAKPNNNLNELMYKVYICNNENYTISLVRSIFQIHFLSNKAFGWQFDNTGYYKLAIFSLILEAASHSFNWLFYTARIKQFREELKKSIMEFYGFISKFCK